MVESGETGVGEPDRKARDKANAAAARRFKWFIFIPLTVFLVLAALFYMRLTSGDDPRAIPSALIDKPAPEFDLPALAGLTNAGAPVSGFSRADLSTGLSLVNVWASWCGPCRQEHPILMRLAEDKRIRLFGINYKDDNENARRFLGTLGNPYDAVGVDAKGRVGIDWGVYGVPETFVVKDGTILFKFIGPLTEQSLKSKLLPELDKAARP